LDEVDLYRQAALLEMGGYFAHQCERKIGVGLDEQVEVGELTIITPRPGAEDEDPRASGANRRYPLLDDLPVLGLEGGHHSVLSFVRSRWPSGRKRAATE